MFYNRETGKFDFFCDFMDSDEADCEKFDDDADFPEIGKIVKAGATTKKVLDYELTMYEEESLC